MTSPASSMLLALPAEIRLLIYDHVFVPSSAYIDPTTATKAIRQSQLPTPAALHLLLSCRKIHTEAYKIAYKKHTFTIQHHCPDDLVQRLAQQLPHSLITSLLIAAPLSHHRFPLLRPKEQWRYLEDIHFPELFDHICSFARHFQFLHTIYFVEEPVPIEKMVRLFYSIREQIHNQWRDDVAAGKEVGYTTPPRDIERTVGDRTKWKIKVRLTNRDGNGEVAWKEVDLLICVLGEDVMRK